MDECVHIASNYDTMWTFTCTMWMQCGSTTSPHFECGCNVEQCGCIVEQCGFPHFKCE